MTTRTPSPSRTYVAVCNKSDFSGHYFRKFTIPTLEEARNANPTWWFLPYLESGVEPEWWFLNVVDFASCIEFVVTWEDYQDLKEIS